MKRTTAVAVLFALAAAACAHDHSLARGEVSEIQNDSPAVSAWGGSAPNDVVKQDGAHPQGVVDED